MNNEYQVGDRVKGHTKGEVKKSFEGVIEIIQHDGILLDTGRVVYPAEIEQIIYSCHDCGLPTSGKRDFFGAPICDNCR